MSPQPTLRFYKGDVESMTGNNIFVYGANTEYRNGLGAAMVARNFGALPYASGPGIVGNTYGLITKNLKSGQADPITGVIYPRYGRRSLTKKQIRGHIEHFYAIAEAHPELTFFIGYKAEYDEYGHLVTLNNGYTAKDMFALFTENIDVPGNIRFHNSFRDFLEEN